MIRCINRIETLTKKAGKKAFKPALKELDWRNTECLDFFKGECALDRDSEYRRNINEVDFLYRLILIATYTIYTLITISSGLN